MERQVSSRWWSDGGSAALSLVSSSGLDQLITGSAWRYFLLSLCPGAAAGPGPEELTCSNLLPTCLHFAAAAVKTQL